MLSACGTLQNIHIDHTNHTAAPENACAKAYRIAQKNQHAINSDAKNEANDASATSATSAAKAEKSVWKNAAENWKIVAQQCPGRLSESIVYSAQAQWAMLANESSQNKNSITQQTQQTEQTQQEEYDSYIQLREVLDHYKNFKWTHQPLAQAAAAEDKLSFILQTLAAKKVPEISLKYSDMASSNAESLMHASTKGADLRKKIYDIPQKALESGIAHDELSGKDLPIVAIAYMDCAREELEAFNQIIVIEENKDRSAAKNSSDETRYEYSAIQAHNAFKDAVIKLITSRLLRAYALGYPTDTSLILK